MFPPAQTAPAILSDNASPPASGAGMRVLHAPPPGSQPLTGSALSLSLCSALEIFPFKLCHNHFHISNDYAYF